MNEYNDNGTLIFEGEYLNGIKNGKGKQYDGFGNLLFEGEYLEGKRWNGKGKDDGIFSHKNEIIEYLNGEKIYNKNNNVNFNFSNGVVKIEQKNKNNLFSFFKSD